MRHSACAISFAVVLALSVCAEGGAPVRVINAQQEGETTDAPVFIAASEIFATSGAFSPAVPKFWRELIRQDLASRKSRRNLQPGAEAANEPCGGIYLGEADIESPAIRDSAQSTVANATAIIVGRIRSVTLGFFHASPGSLLELDELTHVKTSDSFRHARERLYVRHPYANFHAGSSQYCRETSRAAAAPKVGDHVLVFAFGEPADDDGTFIYSHLNDLIVESSTTGRLHVPDLLGMVARDADNIEGVVGQVRALLQHAHVQQRRQRR